MIGIFGAGRNGSTLLMRLLDGSPGLWVYPIELNVFSSHAPISVRGKAKQVFGTMVSFTALRSRWQAREDRIFLEWVSSQIAELRRGYIQKLQTPLWTMKNPVGLTKSGLGASLRSNIECFLDAVRTSYDDRPLEHVPMHVFKSIEVRHLQRYETLFPQLRFVHIIRHPFSNYESLKRTDMMRKHKPFWFQGGDILRTQVEDRWIPHARYILADQKRSGGRHYVVKYEDLCENPEAVIHSLCRWLGVPPPRDPSCQTVLGGKLMSELPTSPSQAGIEAPARVVKNMAEQFSYDEVLTQRERDLILTRTYTLGKGLGYFSSEEATQLVNRWRLFASWLSPDQWELMNSDSPWRLARALIARRWYICAKLLFPHL